MVADDTQRPTPTFITLPKVGVPVKEGEEIQVEQVEV
jgi:hypothetical protein